MCRRMGLYQPSLLFELLCFHRRVLRVQLVAVHPLEVQKREEHIYRKDPLKVIEKDRQSCRGK